MKKIYFLFIGLVISQMTFSQWQYYIDFDSPSSENNHIIIDHILNPNNIWQIGKPSKTLFDTAYSPTHSIMTDTLNSYPINDTSRFMIKHNRPGLIGGNEALLLDFYYRLNTDSLKDFGMIEVSIDNGISWVDLFQDSLYYLNWIEPKPILTGNTNGWQHFSLNLNMLTYTLGYSDTLLYRFTFISDSIQTNKDGWIIDNFQFLDSWEGITKNSYKKILYIYPNPSNGEVNIRTLNKNDGTNYLIVIYNSLGQIVQNIGTQSDVDFQIKLKSGFYMLKYSDKNQSYNERIIIR